MRIHFQRARKCNGLWNIYSLTHSKTNSFSTLIFFYSLNLYLQLLYNISNFHNVFDVSLS